MDLPSGFLGIEGYPIVSANEMRRLEAAAVAQGYSEEQFMERAGESVASIVARYVDLQECARMVTLLVGKGNNGGDAYVAGVHLLEKGFCVRAVHLYPLASCSPLSQKMAARFEKKGGVIDTKVDLGREGILLDGLVGTGFRGAPDPLLSQVIQMVNQSPLPVVSIDIPSGLCGNTGEVETVAICADVTIFLGLPKWGFFVKKGWDHVGELVPADFGLPEKFVEEAHSLAHLVCEEVLPLFLPVIKRTRHKYDAGYVIAIAGSMGMPGAAILSSLAALRTGSGIVRLFHPAGMEAELSGAPYELIREGWNLTNLRSILTQAERADAFLIGPGMGRERAAKNMLKALLPKITLPCVIDADALFFLSEYPSWKLPSRCVLTPHRGEMETLLGKKQGELDAVQAFVESKKVTLVLKGAPTCIFHPGTKPLIITRGDPGMATAGTGDVLTGMIAALLAQKLPCRQAAALGVFLHGVAGEIAAKEKGSLSMIASDLIEFLPDAFSFLESSMVCGISKEE
jgi:NAD(P)H-hydrate epimerase